MDDFPLTDSARERIVEAALPLDDQKVLAVLLYKSLQEIQSDPPSSVITGTITRSGRLSVPSAKVRENALAN